MEKLSKSEKVVLKAWIIFAIILMLIISVVHINFQIKNKGKEKIDNKIYYVTDRSRYAIVNNSINKYYTYLNLKKYDSILNVLTKRYKDKNKLSIDNLKMIIPSEEIVYESRIMCFININNYKKRFYVEGIEEGLNKKIETNKVYYIVNINEKEISFSLEPITESEYKGACDEAI